MSEKVIGTIAAVIIIIVAAWAMRKAGDALRDTLKDDRE